ncbi:hypothetical protein Tsubulata_050056 [Turnera subulata]|uniref:Uncharacterized protein n=1 Tax=Turnera subulata TaxID=218843 RepID=A0A9Q0FJX9_9ROSI|nr:hypothetical protein Tsubulata_050056 [Turnera subulata]
MEERRSERSFDSAVMDSAVDEPKKRKHAAEGDDNQAEEEEDISPEAESESKHDESSDTKKGGDKKLSKEELAWRERDPTTPSELRTFQFKYYFFREEVVEFEPIQNGYGITTSFDSMVFGVIVPFDLSGPYESSIERMKKFCKMGLDENVCFAFSFANCCLLYFCCYYLFD